MISHHVGNMLSPEQRARWDRALANLRAVEARDPEDPFVFHGTTSLRAALILRDGFDPSYVRSVPEDHDHSGAQLPWPPFSHGVHWGSVNVAAWAVNRNIDADDRPVILFARASQAAASGIPVPDWMALENSMGEPYEGLDPSHWDVDVPRDADWRESLARCGAFAVVGGRHVEGLQAFDPLSDMPVHPDWEEVRARRLAEGPGSRRVQPIPGIVEPTATSHPSTWPKRDADVAIWGEDLVRRCEEREAREAAEAAAEGEALGPAM